MPTNLTQNYKVYPQVQQNVTKTSSKSFRTNKWEKGKHTHTWTHKKSDSI